MGVRADPGGLDHQPAARVDGRTGDAVADADLDRDGLAGQHRGVHRRGALDHHTVGGDLLAGPDHEAVAHRELGDRDAHLLPPVAHHRPCPRALRARPLVAQHRHVLGAQLQQRLESSAGGALGAGLEVAARQDEGGDAGRRLQVDVGRAVTAGDGELEAVPHARHPGVAEEQRPQRPQERGAGAERDQGVHRRGAVPGVGPGGPVERPGRIGDDRGGQGQGQPLPVVELQRGHHRHRDHRHGEHQRGEQPLTQRGQFVRRLGLLLALLDGRGLGQRGGVAGGLDGGDQIGDLDAVLEGDLRLLGGVVDAGGDPVHPVELLLDAGRARGARHSADREFHLR